jgi:beta-aspartyl-peptidase (threonine type)
MTPAFILHGGAGSMREMTGSRDLRYRAGMRAAACAGAAVLARRGSALDAVTAAVVSMEDSGTFNAGLGACLTDQGTVEMDGAVMRGEDRGYGAVASVRGVANPVRLARLVMEETPHCFLVGAGAEDLARRHALAFRSDFPSAARRAEWGEKRRAVLEGALDRPLAQRLAALGAVFGPSEDPPVDLGRGDTVGACALDVHGHLAAAVSTGGIWLKMSGRVGDSPLPGAGLWAVDGAGAAVATGTGETILRVLLCREVVDAMGQGPGNAAALGIALLERHFGRDMAGVVSIAPDGRVGFSMNTAGMGRATWNPAMDEPATAVFPGDPWDRPGVH